jgi:hypothetical protein
MRNCFFFFIEIDMSTFFLNVVINSILYFAPISEHIYTLFWVIPESVALIHYRLGETLVVFHCSSCSNSQRYLQCRCILNTESVWNKSIPMKYIFLIDRKNMVQVFRIDIIIDNLPNNLRRDSISFIYRILETFLRLIFLKAVIWIQWSESNDTQNSFQMFRYRSIVISHISDKNTYWSRWRSAFGHKSLLENVRMLLGHSNVIIARVCYFLAISILLGDGRHSDVLQKVLWY